MESRPQTVEPLAELLFRRNVLVLTGAGCSTESGIPDYRGPMTRLKPRRPIQFREFMTRPEVRRRYWARSTLGWPRFRAFLPNAGHRALAALQQLDAVGALITQNVDRLHHKAGSRAVVELHGALAQTLCMGCGAHGCRDAFQERLLARNPGFGALEVELAPDGDAELADAVLSEFAVPECDTCGGVLKPDVVLFGENVPWPRVEQSYAALDGSDVLLVVGSSLTVFSGYRFVLRAKERGMKVAILNVGESRGDPHADLRLDAPAGEALSRLAEMFGAPLAAAG